MASIFWGLRLEPGKRYTTTVDKSFHVSKASLDCSSVKNESEIVSVMLEEGQSKTSFILCNLRKTNEIQSDLDLNFMSGDRVTFFCKGTAVVHLSGYMILEDEDELGGLGEEEEVEEEEEEEAGENVEDLRNMLNGTAQKRKKGAGAKQDSKKVRIDEDEEEDSDDEEDDEDDTNDFNLSGLAGSDDDDEEEDDDEDESDEDEEEEDESDGEDEEPPKQQTQKQKNKAKGQQNQLTTPGSKPGTPGGDKQKTPKGQQKNNQQQQLSGKKDKGKEASKQDASSPQKFKPTTVQGGVIVKDIKIGNGPVCKNGKMATVYYTGRLKSNNKVFDSTTQGSGFQFRLGKGEVIKGWDIGLQGMKVGGKRLITCPPQMAYGQKGSPPTIPGNSALTFEVELKSVN